MLRRSLLSGLLAAVIWIVISFATGGSAAFAIGGGILCGIVVVIIGFGVRLVLGRNTST